MSGVGLSGFSGCRLRVFILFQKGDCNILIGTWLQHWEPVRRVGSPQRQHRPHQNPLMNLASDISLVFTLVQPWARIISSCITSCFLKVLLIGPTSNNQSSLCDVCRVIHITRFGSEVRNCYALPTLNRNTMVDANPSAAYSHSSSSGRGDGWCC